MSRPTMAGMRGKTLENFERMAAKLFAHDPAMQSLMMSVAQYWNDEADDAVHAFCVASQRRTPSSAPTAGSPPRTMSRNCRAPAAASRCADTLDT